MKTKKELTNKEVSALIVEHLKEIRDLYYKAYPDGDYLNVVLYKDSMRFNNRYYDEDKKYPIDYYKRFNRFIERKEN